MRYTLELDIEAPRAKVVALYDDPGTWPKWQDTFVSAEPISGAPREAGSKLKLVHELPTGETEIVETVESKRLPDAITCTYEAKGAWNRVENRFEAVAPDRTRWTFETEFRCTGMLRIMSVLMPGMFRKSSWKEMNSFKRFVEQDAAGD